MPVWLNGALVADADAHIAVNDRGFTLGDGVFETLRLEGSRARHLERHLARLRRGAGVLGIALEWSDEALAQALAEVAAAGLDPAAARLTLSRGPAPRGLPPPVAPTPTLLITAAALSPPQPPARLVIAQVTRRNERSPLSRIKSLNALDTVLARMEAGRRGADDALLLNTKDRLAEATAANLFLVVDGRLLTPPVDEGALPGVARAVLLETFAPAQDADRRPLEVADLTRASEVILTNSLGVRAVIAVEGRPVGTGEPGPVFEALRRVASP